VRWSGIQILQHVPFSNAVIAAAVPVTAPVALSALRAGTAALKIPAGAPRMDPLPLLYLATTPDHAAAAHLVALTSAFQAWTDLPVTKMRTPAESLAFLDSVPVHPDDAKMAQTPRPVQEFYKHVPTIHLTRNGKTVVVKGPAGRIAPRMDETTAMGWGKWRADSDANAAIKIQAAKARNAPVLQFWDRFRAAGAARREADYQKRCDRAHNAGKPTPARPKFKAAPAGWTSFHPDPEVRAMGHAARAIGSRSDRRRQFRHGRGDVAGRMTGPFIEKFEAEDGTPTTAFRTALEITAFEIFNSALPKLSEIVYGYSKTTVYDNTEVVVPAHGTPERRLKHGGMSVRDMEYLHVDGHRRCMFIVDLDGWWADIEQLLTALRRLLPPEFMPNLITYRGHETLGGVENPHLAFLLPPGARVIWQAGKNKKKQFKLHEMIQRGIVDLLIDLGADPFHTNVNKTKNPLSPKWNVAAQDENFATMNEWRAFLPTITPDIRKMRAKAKKIKALRECTTPEEVSLSSAIFTDGLHARGFLIRAAQRTQDPAYLKAIKSHSGFVSWLYHPVTGVITRRLIHLHQDTPAVRSVLAAQREFVEQHGDTPNAHGQFCNRGRDEYHNLDVNDFAVPDATYSAVERKLYMDDNRRRAGTRTQQCKRDLHCGLMAEEVERRMATGLTLEEVEAQRADVVKTLDKAGLVGRSTAYRLWDYVVLIVALASRYHAVRPTAVKPDTSHPVEVVQSSDQQSESGKLIIVSAPSIQPDTVIPVRGPVVRLNPTSISPARAAGIMKSWRSTVAAWRKAATIIPADTDYVHLDLTNVDDPIVQAVIRIEAQGTSGWSRRRR
jgi:hypothetical protein